MLDDDPSDEDLDRFSTRRAIAPIVERRSGTRLGSAHCGAVVENRIRRERLHPAGRQVSARTKVALVVALLVLLLLWQVF